jgi:hypothetical protein
MVTHPDRVMTLGASLPLWRLRAVQQPAQSTSVRYGMSPLRPESKM